MQIRSDLYLCRRFTRMHAGTALAHDNTARSDRLRTEYLDSEPFGLEFPPFPDEPPAFLCAIYIAFIPQWKPFHYRLCRCAVLYSSADGRRVFGNVCGGAA